MPLTAHQLQTTTSQYYRQYDGLQGAEFTQMLLPRIRDYLNDSLQEFGILADQPSNYLIAMARQGLYQVSIYTGWIPKKREKELATELKSYLTKKFRLSRSFLDFSILFDRHQYYTTIYLSWCPNTRKFLLPKTEQPVLGFSRTMHQIAQKACQPYEYQLPKHRPAKERNTYEQITRHEKKPDPPTQAPILPTQQPIIVVADANGNLTLEPKNSTTTKKKKRNDHKTKLDRLETADLGKPTKASSKHSKRPTTPQSTTPQLTTSRPETQQLTTPPPLPPDPPAKFPELSLGEKRSDLPLNYKMSLDDLLKFNW